MRGETVTYDTALIRVMTWMTKYLMTITRSFCVCVFKFSVQTLSKGFECEPPAAALDDEGSSNIQPGDCTPSPEIRSGGAILVRPHSSAENTTLLEDQQSTVSGPTATEDQEIPVR